MLVQKYGWAIQESLFAETNQDSTFSHTCKNSKMFNTTSKYFSFFNNKPTTCKLSRAYNIGFSYMLSLFVLQFHHLIDHHQDPVVGPQNGTLGWDPGIGLQSETLGWDPWVGLCFSFIRITLFFLQQNYKKFKHTFKIS